MPTTPREIDRCPPNRIAEHVELSRRRRRTGPPTPVLEMLLNGTDRPLEAPFTFTAVVLMALTSGQRVVGLIVHFV
jgi:hypothetical protein